MLEKNNTINAGDSSVNNQAQIINMNGLNYSEVKEIATDLFNSNFLVMKNEAARIAAERATEITDKLLNKLQVEAPSSLNEFATPGMQNSLYNAQKEYAISGDEQLGNMLVDILIQRANESKNTRRKIVLDESIKIAPKLTRSQISLLTFMHFHFKVTSYGYLNFTSLMLDINKTFLLLNDLDDTVLDNDLYFMEILRLGKITTHHLPDFEDLFIESYPSFVMRGFTLEEFTPREIDIKEYLKPCLHDQAKFQFIFLTMEQLLSFLWSKGLTEERVYYIASFFRNYLMSRHQIQSILKNFLINYDRLINFRSSSRFQNFQISYLGTSIAISNYNRLYGERNDLSIWIK